MARAGAQASTMGCRRRGRKPGGPAALDGSTRAASRLAAEERKRADRGGGGEGTPPQLSLAAIAWSRKRASLVGHGAGTPRRRGGPAARTSSDFAPPCIVAHVRIWPAAKVVRTERLLRRLANGVLMMSVAEELVTVPSELVSTTS